MNLNQSVEEEIEESVRFCEELLRRNPDFVPEETDLSGPFGILGEEPLLEKDPEPEEAEEDPVTVIPPLPMPGKTPLQEPLQKTVPAKEPVPVKKGASALKTIRNFFICTVIAVGLGFLITTFVANHTMVEGASMEPTLHNGDNLVVEKVSYLTGRPERFDIVVFEHSQTVNYIKRIIGMPGERVCIKEGKIYINDEPVYDAHSDGSITDGGIAAETVTLGIDEYFVLGDNRDGSEDSRSRSVGPVKASQIKGRAWLRVTPFEQFGVLD